jgi:hypothetical protein
MTLLDHDGDAVEVGEAMPAATDKYETTGM